MHIISEHLIGRPSRRRQEKKLYTAPQTSSKKAHCTGRCVYFGFIIIPLVLAPQHLLTFCTLRALCVFAKVALSRHMVSPGPKSAKWRTVSVAFWGLINCIITQTQGRATDRPLVILMTHAFLDSGLLRKASTSYRSTEFPLGKNAPKQQDTYIHV